MSDSATAQPDPEPEPVVHEHEWRLVNTDGDGTIEIREFLCIGCSAVLIEE